MNNIDSNIININFFNKFILKVFNRLIYYYKISSFFIANILLSLFNFYTLSYNIKFINISIFYNYFIVNILDVLFFFYKNYNQNLFNIVLIKG